VKTFGKTIPGKKKRQRRRRSPEEESRRLDLRRKKRATERRLGLCEEGPRVLRTVVAQELGLKLPEYDPIAVAGEGLRQTPVAICQQTTPCHS